VWHRVIDASPALQARRRALGDQAEGALAAALADVTRARAGDPTPRVAAAALSGVDRLLHQEIHRRMLAGDAPDAVRTGIGRMARRAFALLENGFGDYGTGTP
jgi:hypothetical protein